MHFPYEAFVRDYALKLRVGLTEAERCAPQRILVSITAAGYAPLAPATLTQCIDYAAAIEAIKALAANPDHTELLETLAARLITTLFTQNTAIAWLEVTLTKPDLFPELCSVGITRRISRNAWHLTCCSEFFQRS